MPNFSVKARFINLDDQKVTQVWSVEARNVKSAQNQVRTVIEPFAKIVPPSSDNLTGRGIEILDTTELPKIACLTTTIGKGKLR